MYISEYLHDAMTDKCFVNQTAYLDHFLIYHKTKQKLLPIKFLISFGRIQAGGMIPCQKPPPIILSYETAAVLRIFLAATAAMTDKTVFFTYNLNKHLHCQ